MNAKTNAKTVAAAPAAVINNVPAKAGRKPAKAKPSTPVIVVWTFDAQRYGSLGQEMGQAAVQQVAAAGTYWDRCRTLYVEAQNNGAAQEALDALFGPGDKVKGKKAPWYRTYKSLLNSALTLGLTVTDQMGMSALQKAIKGAKEDAADENEEAAAAKDAQLLEMFKKIAQGCLNRGITKKALAEALKGLEA